MRVLLLLALGATVLSSCANDRDRAQAADKDRAELDKALAGRVAAEPVRCIESSRLNGPMIYGNHTIIYREVGRRIYRNDLASACPALDDDSILIVELHGSQICENDMFRPLQRGTHLPGSFCRFGKFTPYERPR